MVLPGTRKARSQRDQLPGEGRPGLRSRRQQTSAPGGASMNLVALLGIVNSRVEMYPPSRASQSGFAVITASTLISGKSGLLSNSLPGPGASGAQEPAQSSTISMNLGRKALLSRSSASMPNNLNARFGL